ncbi:MAG: DNA-directed RNA polymerase subunit beta', partial [Chloroflexi bacterium]|nr:DNA-directed RNA polymerase subunit beta' [Chloroflexota bacterium]
MATGSAAEEVTRLQKKGQLDVDEVRRVADGRSGDLEEIVLLRPMTENRYRELRDSLPPATFTAGMGAEALLEILRGMDLDALREELYTEATSSTGQRAKKAAKRLRVVEGFRKSENRAEWMILTVLPVLPPDLRPMVQLDGGRFATSDLNDLYRRVINRNNRLKRLMTLGAPDIIVRNEKRMLQEAVDALIDNGRRGRALTGSHNHKLKSLSDMLRGKQGRFRQNLLGKRVDYSGRSVIVVGSTLKLHQCGLPKKMALELFKPFVMNRLVSHGLAPNIRSAKRMVDRVRPEVWDLLEEVIKERPVFLNRAPTLHRLGIQAFEPVLVEGSAIQIHPLVCSAYNADFDGDQMAVHVPIGRRAVEEARKLMLSTNNMLLPSSGEPVVAPTLDIVVGCYYLTTEDADLSSTMKTFVTFDDAKFGYDLGQVTLRTPVKVREGTAINPNDGRTVVLLPRITTTDAGQTVITAPQFRKRLNVDDETAEADDGLGWNVEPLVTTVGRILFNEVLPSEVRYRNQVIDKKQLKEVVTECYRFLHNEDTALVLDAIKRLGFHFATESGLTIALNDITVPPEKAGLLAAADIEVSGIQRNFQRGLLTNDEQEERTIDIWQGVNRRMEEIINERLREYGNLYLMAGSGAKGNIAQIKQMAGMRGLMADPKGKILPLPIRSSFREGLTVLEYFISTHGARKGLADTALRTADSGYLTRRLIDVAQDAIAGELDCGTIEGIWLDSALMDPLLGTLSDHLLGRHAASPVIHPGTGEIIVDRNAEINEDKAKEINEAGVTRVYVRSPLSCATPRGMCRYCYGRSLARGRLVEQGEAIGIIAAQSIGEPGTQLTMRTFHTGGVAGIDITSGLPRVEELFEARVPKGAAPITEIDGRVEILDDAEGRRARIFSEDVITESYILPEGYELLVKAGANIESGTEIARPAGQLDPDGVGPPALPSILAAMDGEVTITGNVLTLTHLETDERIYSVPPHVRILAAVGEQVSAGTALTDGPLNPQDILRVQGKQAVQRYLVSEVQKVYRSQGVLIHDKHIEIIVRQMLRRVRIDSTGDTEFLQGELVDRFLWQS